MFGQRRKLFVERRVMEKHLLGGTGTLIILVKYVECKLLPLNLMYQEERLKLFSFSE